MVWVDEIPQPFAGELEQGGVSPVPVQWLQHPSAPNNSSAQHFNAAPPNSSRPAKLFQQAVEFGFSTGGAARGRSQKVLTRGEAWPCWSNPQHSAVRSSQTPQVNSVPPLIPTNLWPAGGFDCPYWSEPQHSTVPSACKPHVWSNPLVMAVKRASSGCGES